MGKVLELHNNVASHFSQSVCAALYTCFSGIINSSVDAYDGALMTFIFIEFLCIHFFLLTIFQ